MKPVYRSVAVAILQCALVLSVAGKYAFDRERLPRAWATLAPVDPNLPVRGRYLSLRLLVETPPGASPYGPAHLSVVAGQLVATPDPQGSVSLVQAAGTQVALAEQLAFYLPEHAADPSRLARGDELWVEVSVPAKGAPRPVRLGTKSGAGPVRPLPLQ